MWGLLVYFYKIIMFIHPDRLKTESHKNPHMCSHLVLSPVFQPLAKSLCQVRQCGMAEWIKTHPWCYPTLPEFMLRGPSVLPTFSNKSSLWVHLRAGGTKTSSACAFSHLCRWCYNDAIKEIHSSLLYSFSLRRLWALSDRLKSRGNENHQSLEGKIMLVHFFHSTLWKMCL